MNAPVRRLCAVAVLVALVASALPGTASASWSAASQSGGAARSAATAMPAGNQPTATVSTPTGTSVDVAWPASSGGAPVAGYEVRSYDASTGAPRAVGGSCAGIVAGTACSETGVPDGSWRYSVVPRQQAWIGAESPLSELVVIDSSYRALVVSDGPIAYWRLGESSGTTAFDEMDVSDGTYAGGYTLGAAGALANDPNAAVDFNGSTGQVNVPSVPALEVTSQVTIEAWANMDTLVGTRFAVNKGTLYYLYANFGTTIFGIHANGTYQFVTTPTVTNGAWQHLLGTYDGSNLVLYRNGAVVAQSPATGAIASSAAPLVIGQAVDGRLDEVAVYGTALTQAQALAHYQRGNETRPDTVITFPVNDFAYNDTVWNASCGASICGTAGDTGGGVASVEVSVRQAASGNYWTGTAFASATEVLLPAAGTATWSLGFPAANFPAEGSYTVRAVGTDTGGSTASMTTTFTIDRTAPAVGLTFPAAAGTYADASWNAGCASRICGTSADTGSPVVAVYASIRQGSGSYWNGTSFGSASVVWLTATGTTSWIFAFPAANFPAEGSYTVAALAVDLAGNVVTTSRTITIDRTRPAPTGVTLVNANGVVTPGADEVRITFSEALNVSSVCSAWSGTGDQSLGGSGVVVTITDGLLNDTLSVTAGACTLRIGSVATGRDYVLSTSTFSGATAATESRVTWTAATRVLTIHIGSQATGLLNFLAQAAATVTYTPDPAITDLAGNGITTTPFTSAGQRL